MSSKKAAKKSTGKRYSEAEQKEIITFVHDYNKQHGRGGQTAAVKQYGISALTLSKWLNRVADANLSALAGVVDRALGTNLAPPKPKSLDLEIAAAKWLNKQGHEYEIFQSLSSGHIERKTSKGIDALGLFSGGDYTVARIGKGGEPVVEISLSKLLELTKTK